MTLAFELEETILQQAVAVQLIKGELGDKVARELAMMQAEVVTYNRTGAAELLNISRDTLWRYENRGQLNFDPDGRISLLALVEFRRTMKEMDTEPDVERKTKPEGKRRVKNG